MAELADAPGSGSGGRKTVRVQLPPSAPLHMLIGRVSWQRLLALHIRAVKGVIGYTVKRVFQRY